MQNIHVIRRVGNVSLWLAISGFLMVLFDLAQQKFSYITGGIAGGAFLIGLVGYFWSLAKLAFPEKNSS